MLETNEKNRKSQQKNRKSSAKKWIIYRKNQMKILELKNTIQRNFSIWAQCHNGKMGNNQ